MKSLLFVLILSLASGAFANVVEARFGGPSDLKFGVVVEPELKNSANSILSSALNLVQATLKERVNLVPGTSEDLDFIIHVRTRESVQKRPIATERWRNFDQGIRGDAYSVLIPEIPGTPVLVTVLWDEATTEIKNSQRVERPDAFARVTTLLGHEISGNVLHYVSRRKFFESPQFRYSSQIQEQEYMQSEIKAFTAGVEFLATLIQKFSSLLPAKIIKDFESALVREKGLLATHIERANLLKGNVLSLQAVRSCRGAFDGE